MDSASQILNIAERRMRQMGYNAVSYRDIASEIGIKSASLHYHFPKKEDLGAALVRRYAENFQSALVAVTSGLETPKETITAFIALCRHAIEENGLICLCAVLGAEAPGLPQPVSQEVEIFFKTNIAWLTEQYVAMGATAPAEDAKATFSLLEGAMIISSVNDDISIFDAASAVIQKNLLT